MIDCDLQDESDETKMVFFQLPNLPAIKRSTDSSSLEDLTPGFMGKMLVYESGAVKLKLGDKLFDVSTFTCYYVYFPQYRKSKVNEKDYFNLF